MRRGHVLKLLSQGSQSRDGQEQRQADQIQPQASGQSPAAAPVEQVRTESRRGRVLSRLAGLAGRSATSHQPTSPEAGDVESRQLPPQQAQPPYQQEPLQPHSRDEDGSESPRRSSTPTSSSGSGGPGGLVRQDSNLSSKSKSSVVSLQFAEVGKTDYKASLPKVASTAGMKAQLSLNYMTFETGDGSGIEEYHVQFKPDIESIRLRYNLLRTDQAKAHVGSTIHWTGTNLYLPIKLPDKVTTFEVQHPVTAEPVKVRLTFVKTPPVSELLPFYNSLMHRVMNKMDYVIINRLHYSPMHKIAIEQHKLEVWPGWVTSIQKLDGGIKLAIDASFRVLRLETVRDIMLAIRNRARGAIPLKEAFEQELVGSIVMTRYNNKAYRIDEIDLGKSPSDTFLLSKENRQVSYVDYMRHHWNVEVQDPKQPMLVHRPKPRRDQAPGLEVIYLIPELCVTTGLTDEMRSNFTIMKSIDEHTKLPPNMREAKLTEFLTSLAANERASSVLSDWNLKINNKLDVVDGRRLDTESIMFGNNRTYKIDDSVDWTRAATSGGMFKPVAIEDWVLMYHERDGQSADEFMNTLKEVARTLNIPFKAPRIVKVSNDSAASYVSAGKREVKRTDQMVVVMTPGKSQREDRYSACKRLYTCDLPVPCQFIRCGTISNPRRVRSVVQKIAIQMLSKVGGQPWAMKLPMHSFMVVGIDTYHDTIDRNKSCVGVVASMNSTVSAWWSHTFFQNSLEEIGAKLSSVITTAIAKFHALNGFVPEKVIVYRDGVGDGQLDAVLQFEVAQTMNAIKFYMRDSHAEEPEIHVSYVIVQKRINTKMSLRQGNRTLNPLPGTFLDHTITHPEYNDFYLVSQHVNQGTVNPTHYILLTETGVLKLDHHQKLAYKMTHMYYNWTGTIRVPAPCQYAHKLAYLTGQNIRQQANDKLENKLYFL